MKFLLIKELDDSLKPTKAWIDYHRRKLVGNPVGLKAEYVRLVKSIAMLHSIEVSLREEVFGKVASDPDAVDPLQYPNSGEAKFTNVQDFMSRLGQIGDFFLTKYLDRQLNRL